MKGKANLGSAIVATVIVLCAGQVAVAQVEWTYEEVCVQPGAPGSWDSGRHAVGDVVFDGTDYRMYLVGGPETDPIDYSWSVGHWTWNDVMGTWDPDPANPLLVTPVVDSAQRASGAWPGLPWECRAWWCRSSPPTARPRRTVDHGGERR